MIVAMKIACRILDYDLLKSHILRECEERLTIKSIILTSIESFF